MRTKLKMRRKILTSALFVLFIVSIIPVMAKESTGIDLTVTILASPRADYPVVVSLGGVDRVFFANHASDLDDGNWIELSGGTTIDLPSMSFVYDGPEEVLSYPIGGVTVKIDPSFIYDLTYPLSTHQVYEEDDLVSATFLGSPDFGGESVSFMLFKVSSLLDIRDDFLNNDFVGIIETLLGNPVWSQVTLGSAGDGICEFNAPDAGDYLLVVAKINIDWSDLMNSKIHVYSATPVEVVDYTLDVSADPSVVKDEDLDVEATLIDAPLGSYIYGFAMINEASYSGGIELVTDVTVSGTTLSLNGEIMADGNLFIDFFTGEEDQSYLTIALIEELLKEAFDPNELSFAHSTTGSTALPTSDLDTGDYILLSGVWSDWDSRILGLEQSRVTVTDQPPNQPPVADAGSDQRIYVRSTVYFSGVGSYDPEGRSLSYAWDFGDGSIGTGVSTSHVYYSTGTYIVTLTVTDDEGATGSDTMTVRVIRRPTPPPDTGTLSIDTTPVDGEVFVEGTSWGIAPQPREVDIGTYTVTFGDVEGYTTPDSQEAVITKDTTTPITGTYILIPPETGTLSIDTTPVKGEIFVDGEPWGVAPQSQVVDVGTYTVTFGVVAGYTTPEEQVVDVEASLTTDVMGTYVVIPPDMGVLSVDTEPVKGEVVVDGVSWGIAPQTRTVEPGTYSVSFGDMAGYVTPESVDAIVEPGLTKNILGTYTEVPENLPPVADAGGPYSCDRYETIMLDGGGSEDPDGDIVSYEWDFGDGWTGTGVTPSHVYASTGTYTVTLTVTDDGGLTGGASTTVTVSKPPSPGRPNKKPKADAGPNMKISVGSTIHFDGSGSDDPDGTILSYRWDFGDESTATVVDPSHTYNDPGHYTVTLVVKDNRGAEDSDKCEVIVWEWPAPVADKFGTLVPGEQKGFKVDGRDETNTIVTLDTISQVTVTILRYEDNPHPDDPMPADALPIYVDVEVSDPDAVEWPIYVEMFYTDEEIGDLDESTFGIYYWMDDAWQRCSHTGVDMERKVVWAYMTAMEASGSPILIAGLHEIITPPLPPFLDNLVITPEVELGEDITISFDIMNPNNQSITYYARIKVGEISILVDIELDTYETKTVSHTITQLTEGTYDVTVDGLTGSYTVIVTPPPPTPAEFVVSDLMVLPTEIEEGWTAMISVTVTNIGEAEGSYTVEFKVDGETVESDTVTIPGDSVYYSSFEKTWSAGTYQVSVEDLTAGFTVSALPEPDFTIYYLVVVIIIVAIVTLVAYWLWKQKMNEN